MSVRMGIVGQHTLLVSALAAFLEGVDDFNVVAITATVDDYQRQSLRDVSIVILDGLYRNPSADVRRLVDRGFRVIVLTHEHPDVAEILQAGASGVITASTTLTDFATAVRSVTSGQLSIPLDYGSALTKDPPLRQLTPREREVLSLLVQGATTKVITSELGIGANTVRTLVQRILTKLEAHSRLEAVTKAIQAGVPIASD